jgi:class 3 adenylate cyclase
MENSTLQIERQKDRVEEVRKTLVWITRSASIPAYLFFWLADLIYAPHLKWEFLGIRVIFALMSLGIYLGLRNSNNIVKLELGLLFIFIVGAFFITVMIFVTEGVFSIYVSGVILVTFVGLAFVPFSKKSQAAMIILIWAPYYLWSFLSHPEPAGWRQLILSSFFVVSTIIFCLLIRFFNGRLRLSELKLRLKLQEEQKKVNAANNFIRQAFGRYMSDEIVENILKSPEGLALGGEKRLVTIMVTDLRGFTSISELLKPEEIVRMLNSYFKAMIKIAKQFNGTISEISGDSLLILFGAPQDLPDKTQKAVACAITMQNSMKKVNAENRSKDLPEIEMGIGINEAEVVVGNIGSEDRSKYGVVGSGVNMTSRIQSYATGGQIIVSETVKKEVDKILRIDDQMEVHPKGAETPITIYDVGGIGGQYNLVLEKRETDLVNLKQEISIRYRVLDGKYMSEIESKGNILRLSLQGCELNIEKSLDALANIKMNLLDVKDDLASQHFYAKVEKDFCSNPCECKVKFTSLPPAVNGYFQAVINRDMN